LDNRSRIASRTDAKPANPGRAAAGAVRHSLQEVYAQTLPFVLRKARRLGVGESDIDDLTQEVFVAVFRRLHDFEGRSSVRTWVLGILARLVQNYRRGQRRKGNEHVQSKDVVDPDQLADAGADPSEFASRAQAWRVLCALLEQLTEDKAALFVMAELEGMTLREIAALMDTSIGTIASRLRVARSEFAQALARMHGLSADPEDVGALSPQVQSLLRATRSFDDPSDADERRIRARVLTALAHEINAPES
jgi:RNA polymerase sigma-70 factor (ECF subfamily)